MVEMHTCQPPKNQMKTIFPKQEEIKVKQEDKRRETPLIYPKGYHKCLRKNIILISKKILTTQKRSGGSGTVVSLWILMQSKFY